MPTSRMRLWADCRFIFRRSGAAVFHPQAMIQLTVQDLLRDTPLHSSAQTNCIRAAACFQLSPCAIICPRQLRIALTADFARPISAFGMCGHLPVATENRSHGGFREGIISGLPKSVQRTGSRTIIGCPSIARRCNSQSSMRRSVRAERFPSA